MATKEYFPGIGKIKFEGKESMNPMAFRYYDAEKVIMGKKMKDWSPPSAQSVCHHAMANFNQSFIFFPLITFSAS